MTDYEALEPGMIVGVDSRLGDTVTYIVGATGQPRTITGYLTNTGDGGGADGLAPLPKRWFFKVTRAQLPDEGPSRRDRLTSPLLSGSYRPAVDTIDDSDNSSWLFEIQRAKEG